MVMHCIYCIFFLSYLLCGESVLHFGPNCKTGFTLGSKQLVCSAVASLRAMDMLCRRAAQAGIPIDEVDSTFSGLQSRQPEEKFI